MQKTWIAGLVGTLLMAGSIAGYWQFMQHTELQVKTMETLKPVRLLQSGEVIEPSLLRRELIPAAAHHPEAITDGAELAGLTVQVPIAADEELVGWKLAERSLVPGAGERYFSFKTDAAANVNNMIRRGDRVDVWVEFEQPKLMASPGSLWNVGAVKIIEGLSVTGVKTAEGIEVSDTPSLEAVVESTGTQLRSARAKPSGRPELNTYVMSDEVYDAYVLGAMGGRIKLALPELSAQGLPAAQVTALFRELRSSDAFSKTKSQVKLSGDPARGELQGQQETQSGGASAVPGTGGAQSATPSPTAKEVKPTS